MYINDNSNNNLCNFLQSIFTHSDNMRKLAIWLERKCPSREIPWESWLNNNGKDSDNEYDQVFIDGVFSEMNKENIKRNELN